MPDPKSPKFWEDESQKLFKVLFPLFKKSAVDSARRSYNDLAVAGSVDLGISWDMFSQVAIDWAEKNTVQIVAQISKTSMVGFLNEFDEWVKSGDPLNVLVDKLSPYYGPVRAEMVAVTEVTRAYALGNLSVWNQVGGVEGFNVFTAEDDIVCSICEDEQSNNPHALDADAPPYHVNCRCYLQPVVVGEED